MSRFSHSEQTRTSASIANCWEAAERTLADLGAGPRREGSDLVGHLGSRAKMRLIGGLFGSRDWYPVRITISVLDAGHERTILIDTAENFGFGTLRGVEGHMRARCQQVSIQVLEEISRWLS